MLLCELSQVVGHPTRTISLCIFAALIVVATNAQVSLKLVVYQRAISYISFHVHVGSVLDQTLNHIQAITLRSTHQGCAFELWQCSCKLKLISPLNFE